MSGKQQTGTHKRGLSQQNRVHTHTEGARHDRESMSLQRTGKRARTQNRGPCSQKTNEGRAQPLDTQSQRAMRHQCAADRRVPGSGAAEKHTRAQEQARSKAGGGWREERDRNGTERCPHTKAQQKRAWGQAPRKTVCARGGDGVQDIHRDSVGTHAKTKRMSETVEKGTLPCGGARASGRETAAQVHK